MPYTKSRSDRDGTCCHTLSCPMVIARYSVGTNTRRPLLCMSSLSFLVSADGLLRMYQRCMLYKEQDWGYKFWYTVFGLVYDILFTVPLLFALPNVKLESLTLRDQRMTFSHSSKESLRPLTLRDKVVGEELRVLGGCRGVICRVPGYIHH